MVRVNGIPVHPVRFGPQPRHGRHRGAGDEPTKTETPEAATDLVDITNMPAKVRTVPPSIHRKNGLMLDA